MKLVKFLRDYGGYRTGSYQYYEEALAEAMQRNGLVEIYVKPEEVKPEVKPMVEPKEEKKQVEKPKKDKMLRAPGKSK
jgi:hypothetical protein